MTLQRVSGVTFSHLITNRSLTPGRLVMLLKALRALHSSSGDAASLRDRSEIEIGANYLPKVSMRFESHRETYLALSPSADAMFTRISSDLGGYAAEERWQHSNVIHGDPVREPTSNLPRTLLKPSALERHPRRPGT